MNWENFKKYGPYLLCFLVGAGLVSAWALSRPVKVQEKVVYQDRIVEKVVEVEAKKVDEKKENHVKTSKTKVTKPDGTVIEREKFDNKVTVVKTEEVVKYVDKVVEVEKVVFKEKVVDRPVRKDWMVGPMVGIDVTKVTSQGTGAFNFGAQVQRRIAGPVYLGVYGLSNGQAGLTVSMEF